MSRPAEPTSSAAPQPTARPPGAAAPAQRRLDATYQLRVLRTFLKRDLKLWTYFRFNFAIDLLGIVSNAVIYGLIAHFGAGAVRGGYATYVVAGLIFNALANAALTAPYQGLMQAFWSNRLELLMMSPVSLPVFVVGTSLQPYVRALIEAALYFALGGLLFDVALAAPPAPLVFVGALLLGLAAISGLGLIGASLVYHLDARGGQDPLRLFVGILAGLAAGVYFPLYTLPAWAQWLAGLIPQTWALDALRRSGMGQELPPLPLAHALGASPVVTDFIVLIVYAAAALWLGAYAFGRAIAVARQDGRLSHWV